MTYDKNNIFAKIIRGEIPAKKIYEDDFVLAIEDIAPSAPVHILIIPKGEFVSFDDFANKASPETISNFFATIAKIAELSGAAKSGYRLITNHLEQAGQSVFHFHVHLLAGKQFGALLP